MMVRTIALCALVAVSPWTLAAEGTTTKDISKKATETGRAIKDYTVEQRDEAVKSAKASLDEMDASIRRLERKLERDWDKMDEAARKKARATLDALRRQRNDLAEWYGGLKYSSAVAWDEVKAGFAKSYDELKRSFRKATKAF